jgi:hypothetical protein
MDLQYSRLFADFSDDALFRVFPGYLFSRASLGYFAGIPASSGRAADFTDRFNGSGLAGLQNISKT